MTGRNRCVSIITPLSMRTVVFKLLFLLNNQNKKPYTNVPRVNA